MKNNKENEQEMLEGFPVYDAQMIDGKFAHGTNTIAMVSKPATKEQVFYFSGVEDVVAEVPIIDTVDFAFASEGDEEKGLITGVLMLADTPIKRKVDTKTFWLRFTADLVEKMSFKFMKNQFGKNINKEHDHDDPIHDVYLVESYIFDPSRGRTLDSFLDPKTVKPGSWIVTLKVDNDEIRKEIKEKKIVGYSLEGDFGIKVNFTEDFVSINKSIIFDTNISVKDKFDHIKNTVEDV